MQNIKQSIRNHSFAMYFKCDNTENCFVVTKNGKELSERIEDEQYFDAVELDGLRVKITFNDGYEVILTDSIRSRSDAKGIKHWMAPQDKPQQLVNLLP